MKSKNDIEKMIEHISNDVTIEIDQAIALVASLLWCIGEAKTIRLAIEKSEFIIVGE